VCYIQHDECLAGFLISKILFCVLVATVNGTSRNPGQPDVQTKIARIFIVNGAAKAWCLSWPELFDDAAPIRRCLRRFGDIM